MRQVRRWRYYCDFCNKSLGTPQSMRTHEIGCTMNPARSCGVCRTMIPLETLIEQVRSAVSQNVFHSQSAANLLALVHAACGDCPACVLAVMRQSVPPLKFDAAFDFRAELKQWWADRNQEVQTEVEMVSRGNHELWNL